MIIAAYGGKRNSVSHFYSRYLQMIVPASLLEPLLIVGRRSDSADLVFLTSLLLYVQGRSSHKSAGCNKPAKIFLSQEDPQPLIKRRGVRAFSTSVHSTFSCGTLIEFYQRSSRNSSGASQFMMLWPVGVSPVRSPTQFHMILSAI